MPKPVFLIYGLYQLWKGEEKEEATVGNADAATSHSTRPTGPCTKIRDDNSQTGLQLIIYSTGFVNSIS